MVILALSVVLPLVPLILFPTRFFGRGIGSTLLGAALLVGMMMLLYTGMEAFTGGDTGAGGDSAAPAGLSEKDMAALEKLLGP